MNTKQRILVLKLLERQKRDPQYAEKNGIKIHVSSPAPGAKEPSANKCDEPIQSE